MNTPEGSTNLISLALLAKIHVVRDEKTYALTGLEVHLYIRKSKSQLCSPRPAMHRGWQGTRLEKRFCVGDDVRFHAS